MTIQFLSPRPGKYLAARQSNLLLAVGPLISFPSTLSASCKTSSNKSVDFGLRSVHSAASTDDASDTAITF
uniref:Uncharacterized protein n=1 Tax=Steinernema glaseri TaxID=37863 RepID=A0A1I8A371_9BILA